MLSQVVSYLPVYKVYFCTNEIYFLTFHRLLAASMKYRETPTWDVDKVRAIAAQCNKQKYNAKRAGEMSSEIYMLKYIEIHSPVLTEAVVVEVRERYIDVIISIMGLNRRIFFNSVSILEN